MRRLASERRRTCATAAVVGRTGDGRLLAVAHEDADHFMPLAVQEVRRDTAVNATRHGQNDARHDASQ